MATSPETTTKWVRNDHYHCPKCHSKIKCLAELRRGDAERIGQCVHCGLLMVENRYAEPFFANPPDKYPDKFWKRL